MKLQSSTLKYQINKYRNEETKAMNVCLQHNEDLKFELSMIKRMKDKFFMKQDEDHLVGLKPY